MPEAPPMPTEEPRTPEEAYRAGRVMGEWLPQAEGPIADFLVGLHDGAHGILHPRKLPRWGRMALLALLLGALIAISFLAGFDVARR